MTEEVALCAVYGELQETVFDVKSCVTKLDKSIVKLVAEQGGIKESLFAIAKALEKLEDTNVSIAGMAVDIAAIKTAIKKLDKEHDEIFARLRDVESVGCKGRLKKLEDSEVWIARLVIGSLVLAVIGFVFHAMRMPGL